MELARKITAATLSKGLTLKGLTEDQYLGRIAGFAKRFETVTTQYGDAQKLDGEFVAIKPDGSQVLANSCYLPAVVSGMVCESLSDENNQGVKFAFDIFASPNERSKTGYEWKIKPLMEVAASKGMLEFTNSLPALGNGFIKNEPEKKVEVKKHK